MCSLQKLSVQGIRSFSPDQPQVIKFYPLTVILGPNGTGKTTLIECLRYASSGETPPNSNKGKTWVHDPQLSNKSHTVHAQVKLKFTDASKDKIETVVARPVELQLTKDKENKVSHRIRTLGAAIQRGDKTYANAKCVDVETEMLTLLGVSKAVLTNVIFCHQDESNWPLSDGKVLKEKFDAIFGSLGYVKALQKIKNLRKERLNEQKIKQQELMLYCEYKERHEKNEREYQEQKDELTRLKLTVRKADEKLLPLQQQLSDIEIKEGSFANFEKEIAKMKGKLEEQKRMRDDISKSLYEPYLGSHTQLKEEIKNFKENVQKKQLEDFQITDILFEIDKQINIVTEKKSEMLQLKGKLDSLKEEYCKNVQLREEYIKKIILEENIADNIWKSYKNENSIKLLMNHLSERSNQLSQEFSEILRSLDIIIGDVRSQLEEKKAEKCKLEFEIKSTEKITNDKISEKISLDDKLTLTNVSGAKLNRLRRDVQVKKSEYESLKSSTNMDGFNNSLSNLRLKKSNAKAELENLNTLMSRMQSEYATRTEINVLKKNKLKEEENISEIVEMNASVLKRLGITAYPIKTSVYKQLNIVIQKLNSELDNLKSELNTLEKEKSKNEALYKVEEKKHKEFIAELNQKTKELQHVCGKRSYNDFFSAIKELDKSLKQKYTSLENSKFIWNDVINDIQLQRQCIVCCRNFENELQMNTTISNIKKRIESCPSIKKSLENEMKEKNELLEKLHSLGPTNEKVNTLPKLIEISTSLMDDLREKLCGLRYSIEARNQSCTEKMKEIEALKSFEENAVNYDRSVQEISVVERKIEKLSQKLSDSNGLKSMDDLRDEIERKTEEISSYEKDLERINRKKNEYSEQLISLQKDLNELEGEILVIEKEQQSKVHLEAKISELANEINEASTKMKQLNENVLLAYKAIEELEKQLNSQMTNKNNEEERFRVKIDAIKNHFKLMEEFNALIDRFVKEGKEEKLHQLQCDQKQTEEELKKLNEQKVTYSNRRELVRKEIFQSEISQRNLEDNARLFDYLEEIQKLEASIKVEEAKFEASDISTLRREKRQIGDNISSRKGEKDRAISLQTPVVARIRILEDEMKLEKYKKAKDNFRKKQLEVMAEAIICEDLDKYYKALDHSVMTYHQKKMQDINKLVFKLWKQTYRGGDIEFIKIAFDENEERSASDRKRNFNYRVVMVKEGGVELDMRGRCSAGQKVLASLVIRLALAEIFCINCGILALDEPTTNLDKENIQSFANAISEIVKSHKKLNNFQMIIITHDEEFLKCLDEESDEYYYRVYKENGFSKIKLCSLKERE